MSREYVLQPFRAPVQLHIDYAQELNEQQFAAVTAVPGPALVIAGAGSGKTRTLTYRVAYLLEQGISPDRILLLTFTNKAAREMMRRVADLLGQELPGLWGGTFHSIGARLLRANAAALGYRSDFTIMDREDVVDLFKACLGELEIDQPATRFPKPELIAGILSMSLNTSRSIAQIIAEEHEHFVPLTAQIESVTERYALRKRAANLMDFDDLLSLWLQLLQRHPEICEAWQRRFQFILVDEYQDTNKLQSDIIDLLGARHKNVMVVGDDAQSIYAWRGANFKNILEFPNRYQGAKIYRIEKNYRSTPEILAVANAAIAANIHQFTKTLTPERKSGTKPTLVTCGDTYEQAAFVAQRALELREEGVALNEMVILYRSHFHALELQLEFLRRNIPFQITSGIRFFEQAHVKDVAAWIKFIHNPSDELALKRLLQLLPGVGAKGADKLWRAFRDEQAKAVPAPPLPAVEAPAPGAAPVPAVPALAIALQRCASKVPKKALTHWAQFTATISQLEIEPVRSRPAEMINLVLEAGYEDYLEETFANHRNRREDLEQLATFALQFQNTEEFLTQFSLLTNIEADDRPAQTDDPEQIRLSTIHQAKGLEFRVVFMIMLCDGLFPSSHSTDSIDGEEEERRLFYVAITRAKDELYISYPLIRRVRGSESNEMQQPSRFLREIPEELVEIWNLRPWGSG